MPRTNLRSAEAVDWFANQPALSHHNGLAVMPCRQVTASFAIHRD